MNIRENGSNISVGNYASSPKLEIIWTRFLSDPLTEHKTSTFFHEVELRVMCKDLGVLVTCIIAVHETTEMKSSFVTHENKRWNYSSITHRF
jgi:hypothetical protein